jgi:hypothetical protein
MSIHRKISRRTCLKGLAVFSATAGMPLMLTSTAAEAKASKAAVHYRDYPKGMQMCHMCKFYIAGGGRHGGMGRVWMSGGSMMNGDDGSRSLSSSRRRISPMGWRDLYTPLGA